VRSVSCRFRFAVELVSFVSRRTRRERAHSSKSAARGLGVATAQGCWYIVKEDAVILTNAAEVRLPGQDNRREVGEDDALTVAKRLLRAGGRAGRCRTSTDASSIRPRASRERRHETDHRPLDRLEHL
jgi:hypothetical protein